jgi:hypothetical protein
VSGAPFSVKDGHLGSRLVVTLDEIANRVVRFRDADFRWSNANLRDEKAKPLATKRWIGAKPRLDRVRKPTQLGRVQCDWID